VFWCIDRRVWTDWTLGRLNYTIIARSQWDRSRISHRMNRRSAGRDVEFVFITCCEQGKLRISSSSHRQIFSNIWRLKSRGNGKRGQYCHILSPQPQPSGSFAGITTLAQKLWRSLRRHSFYHDFARRGPRAEQTPEKTLLSLVEIVLCIGNMHRFRTASRRRQSFNSPIP